MKYAYLAIASMLLCSTVEAAEFSTALYQMAGSIKADGYYAVLAIQCNAINLDQSVHKLTLLRREEEGLSTTDKFNVDTIYARGGTEAEHALAANKTAACALLTPDVLARVRGLAEGTRLVLNPDWYQR